MRRVRSEIVVVVGGPDSVSESVVDSISQLLPGELVRRIDGADRYAVSRDILVSDLAAPTSSILYVADGRNFPDALSSVAAAARLDTGVLLVNGGAPSLSAQELRVVRQIVGTAGLVKIVGGPMSVSADIEKQLGTVAAVKRLGGADRYAVSEAIVHDAMPAWFARSRVFLAGGNSFADALAGGAVAGQYKAPLLLAHTDCVPSGTLALISALSAPKVTLFGGPTTLDGDVANLVACP